MKVVDISQGKKKAPGGAEGEEDVWVLPCPDCDNVNYYVRSDGYVECTFCSAVVEIKI